MASLIRDLPGSTAEMLAVFGDAATVSAALRFEAALARAEADEGLIPGEAADAIAIACDTARIDSGALAAEAAWAGTLAIPLVAQLRALVGARDPEAAAFVHHGATSQDLADTVLMLQATAGAVLVEAEAERLLAALDALTQAALDTPMLGRTLLQGALPISFGLKTGQWLLGLEGALERFRRERGTALQLQFGGAAGARHGLDGKGEAVAARLAGALGLHNPPLPWHARRESVAGLGAALGILIGATGKIAVDVALLAQGEVGEAFEPRSPGRGGSSAMAHKRNPTGCQVARSAALRAPGLVAGLLGALPQEHERGLGGWQVEGPILAELFGLAHGALAALVTVVGGLECDTEAMARNLDNAAVGEDRGEAEALARAALDHFRKMR
jgi:3-carboxy-cis,cis-muconate cycloisomerase